uniref:Thiamine-monophosphate kinase (Thiamine-phosphate kinase) n=1 Tax=mine drainage metagenome TaxID=410659 RepID=E6PJK3_9ZZZZ
MASTLGEFDLIARYFTRPARNATLGVGDDCALLAIPSGQQLAVSSDMLVEGRHFLPGADARKLGHKALAVNLSDLAAMGAQPLAFTLALALPTADAAWLEGFSAGLFALADEQTIELIGGDTTKGPLNICITVLGLVPPGLALRRDAARAGDALWVSGTPGDARLALGHVRGEWSLAVDDLAAMRARMDQPTPRVALGQALRGIAHAAIDISDGLLGDLGHVLRASHAGACIEADRIPASRVVQAQPAARRRACQLAGGDDYELLFTAPAHRHEAVLDAASKAQTPVACIGRITAAPGVILLDAQGHEIPAHYAAFDHFRTP